MCCLLCSTRGFARVTGGGELFQDAGTCIDEPFNYAMVPTEDSSFGEGRKKQLRLLVQVQVLGKRDTNAVISTLNTVQYSAVQYWTRTGFGRTKHWSKNDQQSTINKK